ncbi:MAG: bifunctional aspartate kinase/homoserine dehydrogenase I [Thermoanaerobaculia bacterium]|jgi:aspartokinase/homoserine dehydrogenase 1
MSLLKVFKFGGTSVGSAEAVRAAVEISRRSAPRLAVVVSASSGTTDLLLRAARAALARDRAGFESAAKEFRSRHLRLVDELIADATEAASLRDAIDHSSRELFAMCESIGILRELSPRVEDAIAARGERAMAMIFAATLRERGLAVSYVDATEVIVTEKRGQWPDFARCESLAREIVRPLLDRGDVVVLPGFIAQGPAGEVVTLGRGGTDFSAAIVARSLGADELTLWKEVHGLMTADPRAVPEARVIPEMHYREAAELAYYGAKVLHPRTMIPLIERAIPLRIRNTFDPDFEGTRIAGDVEPGAYPVKALSAISDQALITIEGNGMIGVPGIAGRTFTALSSAGHSVSMISQASSESSICFVVPQQEADDCVAVLREAFAQELDRHLIDDVRAMRDLAVVAVVGLGMRGTPGIASRVFSAFGRESVNIVAIAQGSSELNVTIVIAQRDLAAALTSLHREFQLTKLRPLTSAPEREASVALLGIGRVGRELVRQIASQQTFLANERGATLRVVALADRSGLLVSEQGMAGPGLEDALARKEKGESLVPGGRSRDAEAFRVEMRNALWSLPLRRPVFVDATAGDTAALVLDALRSHAHVVLANKKPMAVPQAMFDEIVGTAREHDLQLRYEATVGAGLPILDTFAKLQDAGDRVTSVEGCLSGTLGFLMTKLEDGMPYSDAVRQAWELGYTEPDPRDDLSGMDVARKALILARTLGMRIDLADIAVEKFYPDFADDSDARTFLDKLKGADADIAARISSARSRGCVLRYAARIGDRGVRVGLEEVPQASPMGRLRGTDNQIVIRSMRYDANPLVVIGPGAGAEVTAAGVLNDIVAIATHEERRSRFVLGGVAS